ncbi:hypothetical protein DRQ18_06385 [bacterium]|nr:MAG: hypothetical protein DRQ18_06385 [bacterium]
MRKLLVISIFLVFAGCGNLIPRYYWEVYASAGAPNWTQDNRVCFVLAEYHSKIREDAWGRSPVEQYANFYLYEINYDGTDLRKVATIYEGGPWYEPLNSSSAGEWVVVCLGTEWDDVSNSYTKGDIYIIKRDGSYVKKIKEGLYPDFSPDASKIVYEKPDSGIWIMDRDGGNNHCIVSDPDAKYPAWSPDDTLIAYGYFGMEVFNIKMDSIVKEYEKVGIPDWGPSGSNKIVVEAYGGPLIIDILTDEVDSIGSVIEGNRAKWSPDGQYFIAYDGSWFVIKKDGTDKWYINSKIKGGE